MKTFVLILLLVIGFLLFYIFTQPQHPVTSSQLAITPTTTSVGSTTTSTCKANHINPADPQAYLPDLHCTPGVANPTVTQDNIHSTICVSGFTKTIRPPVSYTNKLKREQIKKYGFTDAKLSDYEEDHDISLELGGSPTDPKNLWPEPHASINEKDKVENYLHKQVCSGNLSLAQAQTEITQNWYTVYLQIQKK